MSPLGLPGAYQGERGKALLALPYAAAASYWVNDAALL